MTMRSGARSAAKITDFMEEASYDGKFLTSTISEKALRE
jgi:hypothetical protein